MNPIVRLLEEHWQELQGLREEYMGYALSTAPADRERFQHSIARVYQLHGVEAPQVVWLDSLSDAKLMNALCTYISAPRVHFSLRGPFGLYDGKDGLVSVRTPDQEVAHRERLKREFPTLFTEDDAQETLSSRIWNSFLQPNVDAGRLYRTLQAGVGIISDDPLQIVLRGERGHLPEGSRPVSLIAGDGWGEPLPGILNLIDKAMDDQFGSVMEAFSDAQWLALWKRYEIRNENWQAFGSQFKDMSQERRDEIRLYLRRFTALGIGAYGPMRHAPTCGRLKALEVMGREHGFAFDDFTDLVKAGGWWWPFEGICLAFDNPAELHLDDRMRLHNENGACVRFRDDWGFSAVHGVVVPEFVARNEFDAADIDAQPNAEVRHVMLKNYGVARYINESGAQEINKDEYGILYRKTLRGGEAICIVEVINKTPSSDGDRKKYHLCVPPNMTSAKQAVAWTFRMSAEEYNPVRET